MDARARCDLERLGAHVDITLDGAREPGDDTLVTGKDGDILHGLEVTRARHGKARLDDINVEAQELTRDDELLLGVHARARRLLAVAQRGVEYGDLATHGVLPPSETDWTGTSVSLDTCLESEYYSSWTQTQERCESYSGNEVIPHDRIFPSPTFGIYMCARMHYHTHLYI